MQVGFFVNFILRKIREERPTSEARSYSCLVCPGELLRHGPGCQGEGGGVELDTWHIEVASLGGHGSQEVGNCRGGSTGELTQAGSTNYGLHP